MRFAFIPAILCLLLCACGKQQESDEIILYVGLYDTGQVFMDHDGMSHYQIMTSGNFEDSDEVRCEAEFGREFGVKDVEIKLSARFEGDDLYVITGTYEAKLPFRLEYLGSAKEDEDHLVHTFDAGSGKIEFRGKSPYTYTKP